jgi:flavin reductase (DIM6/NTAB) family NADH-FMN oxidoreductase RutF
LNGRVLFYEPASRDRAVLPHDPFKAIVAPRPIGWVSTIGPDGEFNLAPYSFFNAVGENPPMIAFSSTGAKHSSTFAVGTGEFVWNMPTWDLREQMNLTSKELPRGESEFGFAGLTPAPSRLVAPPRVAEAHVALECRVVHNVALDDVNGDPANQHLVVGQVIGVHIDEAFIEDGRLLTAKLQPVARCGYREEYTVVRELFAMWRPT